MKMNKSILGILAILVAISAATHHADASELKYRIRKRVCEMYDTCPTTGGTSGPANYKARIDQDPITGANQALVSFTISEVRSGDLFNWVLDDTNSGTAALSGNGTISGTSQRVLGVNTSPLSDGTLTLRVQVSRNGVWGDPTTDTATKNTSGGDFVAFSDGFDDATASAAAQPLTSNEITVSGFAGSLAVSVSGDASAKVSIDGAACATSGTITANKTISLCANSPTIDTSKTITVTVGASSVNWKVSTSSTTSTSNVVAWGKNSFGQLGDNSVNDSNAPVEVLGAGGSGFLGDVAAIDSGWYHNCARKTDNTVWCWGMNGSGQLGNNTNVTSTTPVQVVGTGGAGFLNDVVEISSGDFHSCALRSNGTVWCWGSNTTSYFGAGRLGDNTAVDRLAPVQVVDVGGIGFLGDVVKISAGNENSCALKSNGTVWCWGYNLYGEVGDGTTTYHNSPVQVVGPGGSGFLGGVAEIAMGGFHACARKTDNTVWCWGMNSSGGLGNNTDIDSNTPVQVVGAGGSGFLGSVVKISSGEDHSCALRTDGAVWCWGNNYYGSLGDNTTTNRLVPVQVLGLGGAGFLTGVSDISGGQTHTCAIKTDGTAWCWGNNAEGMLGNNSSGGSLLTPVQVAGIGGSGFLGNAVKIGSGRWHSFALTGGTPSDTAAPTISTLLPQPGSTDVAENVNLVITFGEDVIAGTGNIVIRKLSDGTVFETILVTDARVTIAGKVTTINPTALFASNTAYYVEVAAGAFKDAADNNFAGITGSSTWAFTSEVTDFAPPLVATLSPANGSTGVAVAANLVITFDEPVAKGSGNIVIKKTSDGTAVETIPVSDARVSVSGNSATINPTGTFASFTGYYVEVAAGAFRDSSGNAFAGITGSSTWAFTSVNSDTVAPAVQTLSPADGVAGVAVDANLVITFSENVVKGSGNIVIDSPTNGIFETIPVSDARVSVSGNQATINPAATFASGTDYYVIVDAGAFKDAAGNNFAGITVSTAWNFTTVAALPDPACSGSPGMPGTVLADGSVYAGCTPDGNVPMYVTRCDAGMDWNGSACAGTRSAITWNNGTSNFITTGIISTITGEANTTALAGLADGGAPYQAAQYCNNLDMHGKTDWYLPAYADLGAFGPIFVNRVAIGGFDLSGLDPSGWYWSSTESLTYYALLHKFSDGSASGAAFRYVGHSVRCARTGDTTSPTGSSLSPADGSADVAANANLVITFSENVVKGSGTIVIDSPTDGIFETIPVSDARVSVSGNQATINPAATFASGTDYYVIVDAGAFVDESGNPHAGITTSSSWNFTTAADPCAGSPVAGTVCADGSVYAGISPDGNVPMFVTRCDAGGSLVGSTCTGRSGITWNNGTDYGSPYDCINWGCTGATSITDGRTNTDTLAGATGRGSPHQAAIYCQDLELHGKTDWYLPAKDELNVLYTNRVAIGGFDLGGSYPSGYYWSSSEYSYGAWDQRFFGGAQNYGHALFGGQSVRCARR